MEIRALDAMKSMAALWFRHRQVGAECPGTYSGCILATLHEGEQRLP